MAPIFLPLKMLAVVPPIGKDLVQYLSVQSPSDSLSKPQSLNGEVVFGDTASAHRLAPMCATLAHPGAAVLQMAMPPTYDCYMRNLGESWQAYSACCQALLVLLLHKLL